MKPSNMAFFAIVTALALAFGENVIAAASRFFGTLGGFLAGLAIYWTLPGIWAAFALRATRLPNMTACALILMGVVNIAISGARAEGNEPALWLARIGAGMIVAGMIWTLYDVIVERRDRRARYREM